MKPHDIETFFKAYLECALWSSNDESTEDGGHPMDANYDFSDIAPEVLINLRKECVDFIESEAADLANIDAELAGHDFWLTRNHHGAGFWGRGLGEIGRRLTEASHAYGGCDLYIGDDGQVWASGYEKAQS